MERRQAEKAVLKAARKVANTLPENYPHERQFLHVLTERIESLRRALKELDDWTEED